MTTERKYRLFTPEFKREAVRQMSDSNKHCTQLARDLGIRVNQLYKWKKELEAKPEDAFPGSGRPAGPESELAKLKRENERLKQENETFNSVLCQEPCVKYAFIRDHAGQYPKRALCRSVGASPSGCYAWRSRPESGRLKANRTLLQRIEEIRRQTRQTYGPLRIRKELLCQGIKAGLNRSITKLKRQAGLITAQAKA